MTTFAIIGFGEVGGIFARDLYAAGASGIAAYDIDEAAQARAAACGGGQVGNTAVEAATSADVVFVSVTAGSTLAAAKSLSGGLGRAPFVVDVNSVSPATKRCARDRDHPHQGEPHLGRRHPVVLRRGEPGMAPPFPEPPDRRPAHPPPDPEMAEREGPGRRGRERR